MNFLKVNVLTLIILILGPLNLQAQNEKEQIRQMLVDRDNEIKELLGPEGSEYTDTQRDQLKDIINGIIDFESMAKYALSDTYGEISEEERTEFVHLFSNIIRDQSLNKLDIYRANVSYEEITVDGSTAKVETIAELDEVRTPVNYELMKKDGQWMITDMIIDDVSTAESYNQQFQRIITRRGFDALMNSLRKRAART